MHLARKAARAAAWLRQRGVPAQRRAVMVGASRGGFSNELERVSVVPLREVPGCRQPLLPGWDGVLVAGDLGGEPAIVQEGRIHLFEGFLPGEVAFTVRVLAELGVRSVLFVAEGRSLDGAGGAEATLVADRIDWTGVPLLRGALAGPQGPVFEPGAAPAGMRAAIRAAAASCGVALAERVVAHVHGPAWPTPAEEAMLRALGAGAVTMALAPELATASRLGLAWGALVVERGVAWERRHLELCLAVLAGLSGGAAGDA